MGIPAQGWVPAESHSLGDTILQHRKRMAHLRQPDEERAEWPIPKIGAKGRWPAKCGLRAHGELGTAGQAWAEGYELCAECWPGRRLSANRKGESDE